MVISLSKQHGEATMGDSLHHRWMHHEETQGSMYPLSGTSDNYTWGQLAEIGTGHNTTHTHTHTHTHNLNLSPPLFIKHRVHSGPNLWSVDEGRVPPWRRILLIMWVFLFLWLPWVKTYVYLFVCAVGENMLHPIILPWNARTNIQWIA